MPSRANQREAVIRPLHSSAAGFPDRRSTRPEVTSSNVYYIENCPASIQVALVTPIAVARAAASTSEDYGSLTHLMCSCALFEMATSFGSSSVFYQAVMTGAARSISGILNSFSLYSVLFTTLGKPTQAISITTQSAIHIGFSTTVPTLCANNPVKNGAIAPPLLPIELMKPRLVICR